MEKSKNKKRGRCIYIAAFLRGMRPDGVHIPATYITTYISRSRVSGMAGGDRISPTCGLAMARMPQRRHHHMLNTVVCVLLGSSDCPMGSWVVELDRGWVWQVEWATHYVLSSYTRNQTLQFAPPEHFAVETQHTIRDAMRLNRTCWVCEEIYHRKDGILVAVAVVCKLQV